MPVMLYLVAERIPVPDSMAEPMPDLMPPLIGDVVPLVTDPITAYLRGVDALADKDRQSGAEAGAWR
jgi:hypothetical protein